MGFYELHKKAEEGNADAQAEVGRRYFRGIGDIEEHYPTAIYWCEKAAEQNNSDAMYTLGLIYSEGILADGHGVEPNFRKSFEWYLKSAELGKDIAQTRVGDIYFYGTEAVAKDYKEAMR